MNALSSAVTIVSTGLTPKSEEVAVNKIASLGIGVENLYNYPQDIEGVYYDGNFYIVQTRPQV